MSAPTLERVDLDQRGRAELGFLRSLRGGLAPLKARTLGLLEREGAFEAPFTTIEDLRGRTDPVLAGDAGTRFGAAVLRWAREQTTPRAVAAYERRRDELEPLAVPAGLERFQDRLGPRKPPAYWTYEFHTTTGGWDGHPQMGFVHHELVYRHLLMAAYGPGIFNQRQSVAEAAPRESYTSICDLGCGTGQYTVKLAETYPQARITGVDLSRSELLYALRRGEERGLAWQMVRAAAEDTGLPGGSFDLVTSFILLHEVPPAVTRRILAEAYRLLEPGGDVHFSDVTPYARRTPQQAWADDWDAEQGNEPWWRTAATLDLAALATEAGFEDVQQRGLGPGEYPWVLTARKPLKENS
ncbi:class I SAM-dependent methyltransferase [Kineosporia babensis]|uniref:Methyltransferase domain-containing protein n=1 Tax=Kineosporia babensis TaxID=499548 RepID=A0A9X1SVS3_9ACTN|nr:methyltransferase domain-containing protein [Kineosporia babensis]